MTLRDSCLEPRNANERTDSVGCADIAHDFIAHDFAQITGSSTQQQRTDEPSTATFRQTAVLSSRVRLAYTILEDSWGERLAVRLRRCSATWASDCS